MKRLLLLLAPLALAAAPLAAQDAHFGIQAGVNFPQSDLKDFIDNKLGISVGANATIELGSGHVIRPRADYAFYSASVSNPLFTDDRKVKALSVGADYMYFPAQRMEGFYATAGIGVQNTKLEDFTGSDNKTAFAWALGGGWQFTDVVGAELRYTSSHPSFDGGTFKADALNLGVTFKF